MEYNLSHIILSMLQKLYRSDILAKNLSYLQIWIDGTLPSESVNGVGVQFLLRPPLLSVITRSLSTLLPVAVFFFIFY